MYLPNYANIQLDPNYEPNTIIFSTNLKSTKHIQICNFQVESLFFKNFYFYSKS